MKRLCVALGVALFLLPGVFAEKDEPGVSLPQNRKPAELADDTVKSLVLVDEGAGAILDLMERLTGKSVLRKQNLPQVKITFNSRGPLKKEDAVTALESLLSMNGIAILEMGSFLKAVPVALVSSEAPAVLEGSAMNLAPSEKIYTKLFQLQFLDSKTAGAHVKGILTPKVSSSVELAQSSSIMITDTLANLQRVEALFNKIDKPLASEQELVFYPMKFMNAGDLRDRLRDMQKNSLKAYISENTSFDADEGSNQLLVLTNRKERAHIEALIRKLDVDAEPLTQSAVIRMKHANAKDVSDLIKAVVKGQALPSKDKKGGEQKKSALERLRETIAKRNEASQAASKSTDSSSSTRDERFSAGVTIEADERSNSIVVYGTPRDLSQIRALIDELDVLLAQVRIEVVIAQVTLNDDQVSGLSSFGIGYNGGFPSLVSSTLASATSTSATSVFNENNDINLSVGTPALPGTSDAGFSFNGSLKNFSLSTVFNVARRDNSIKILSAPTVMTTHNKEASVIVGEKRPLLKSSTTDVANSSTTRNNFEYADISLNLTVKPLIGSDGVVQMEIDQKVDNIVGTLQSAGFPDQPIIGNREAKSFVSVADNEVIVLAGLQEDIITDNKGKLWLLGDIPLIGEAIFSPKTKAKERRELIIFIKPYVLNTAQAASSHTKDYMRTTPNGEAVQHYFDRGEFPAVESPSGLNVEQGHNKVVRNPHRRWRRGK